MEKQRSERNPQRWSRLSRLSLVVLAGRCVAMSAVRPEPDKASLRTVVVSLKAKEKPQEACGCFSVLSSLSVLSLAYLLILVSVLLSVCPSGWFSFFLLMVWSGGV